MAGGRSSSAWQKLAAQAKAQLPWTCARCGKTIHPGHPPNHPAAVTVGHINPVAHTGRELVPVSQLQLEHRSCGSSHGATIGNHKRGQDRAKRKQNDQRRRVGVTFSEGTPPSSPAPFSSTLPYPGGYPEGPGWDVWGLDVPDPETAGWPRIMSGRHPDAVGTLGQEFLDWADGLTGLQPRRSPGWRWWQRLAAYRALEVDAAGALCWRTVVLTVPRQQGKSWFVRALLLWRLHQADRFGEEQTILHTAHKLVAAAEVWRPAARWAVREFGRSSVRWANGEQQIDLGGSRWLIQAATDGAATNFSLTMALVEEAWRVRRDVVDGAIDPTMAEAEQPQLWLVSTAGDSGSDLMRAYRGAALEEGGPLLLEWSAPPGTDLDDVGWWRWSQAHWDGRRSRVLAEKRGAVSRAEFESQWLNMWQEHAVAAPGEPLFDDVDVWLGLRVPGLRPGSVGVVGAAAVEDFFGRGGAVGLAWWDAEGRVCVWADRLGSLGGCWDQVAGVAVVRCGVSLRDSVGAVRVGAMPAGTRESASALPVLRGLVADGGVRWDGARLGEQAVGVRVRAAGQSSGGLVLVPGAESDVLRVAAWAVRELTLVSSEAAGVF